jgi:hypothetical protein
MEHQRKRVLSRASLRRRRRLAAAARHLQQIVSLLGGIVLSFALTVVKCYGYQTESDRVP